MMQNFSGIPSPDDCNSLQQAVDAHKIWSRKWLQDLNIKKCQFSLGDMLINCILIVFVIPIIIGERGNEMLNLGVMFDEKLTFKEHIHAKINKA